MRAWEELGKTQESVDERWVRLDKRIESARERHELAHPVMWTSFLVIGRAKRAPHWGVQSRFRVIYICMSVGMYVCRYVCLSWSKKRRRKYVGRTRACSKSVLCGKIRPVTPVLLEKWFPLWGERAHSLKLFLYVR